MFVLFYFLAGFGLAISYAKRTDRKLAWYIPHMILWPVAVIVDVIDFAIIFNRTSKGRKLKKKIKRIFAHKHI